MTNENATSSTAQRATELVYPLNGGRAFVRVTDSGEQFNINDMPPDLSAQVHEEMALQLLGRLALVHWTLASTLQHARRLGAPAAKAVPELTSGIAAVNSLLDFATWQNLPRFALGGDSDMTEQVTDLRDRIAALDSLTLPLAPQTGGELRGRWDRMADAIESACASLSDIVDEVEASS